jgi:hypothetical protein
LSLAASPKDAGTTADEFFRQQKALFEEERKLRKAAKNNNRGISSDDEIPPALPYPKIEEQRQSRKTETMAFIDRYLSAKESIMKRTELFWRKSKKDDIQQQVMPLDDSVEVRLNGWEDDGRELEDFMTEVEILASSSADLGQAGVTNGGNSILTNQTVALPVLWCALMTMCSRNMLGLVLSLAVLNYNLRLGE